MRTHSKVLRAGRAAVQTGMAKSSCRRAKWMVSRVWVWVSSGCYVGVGVMRVWLWLWVSSGCHAGVAVAVGVIWVLCGRGCHVGVVVGVVVGVGMSLPIGVTCDVSLPKVGLPLTLVVALVVALVVVVVIVVMEVVVVVTASAQLGPSCVVSQAHAQIFCTPSFLCHVAGCGNGGESNAHQLENVRCRGGQRGCSSADTCGAWRGADAAAIATCCNG